MSLSAFLYRRLSRWVTCELAPPGANRIALRTKHDVASASDVFCHPFYWQLFHWLSTPPRLVVDCGANCGHFSLLAEMCIRSKFGGADARYLLIEPNPLLIGRLARNLSDAGLAGRTRVIHGLLGTRGEARTLWVQPSNFLASGLTAQRGAKPYEIPGVRLRDIVPDERLDVLKIDIEGAEFSLIEDEPDVMARVGLLCLEVHSASRTDRDRLARRLEAAGLTRQLRVPTAEAQELWLCTRTRWGTDPTETSPGGQAARDNNTSESIHPHLVGVR